MLRRYTNHTILALWAIIGTSLSLKAQTKSIPDSIQYSVLLMFQSVCCGVPDQEPLDKALRKFAKREKTGPIEMWKIGPMGREGEYYLVFDLKKWKPATREKMVHLLEQMSKNLREPGHVSIEKNGILRKSELPERATMEKLTLSGL